MKKYFVVAALMVAATGLCRVANAEVLTLDQAIARALAHDPRVHELEYVTKHAQALLQEAEGSDDTRVSLNTFLGSSTALKGGLFKADQCSTTLGECTRDDRYDLAAGLSPWWHLEFSIIKPFATMGKLENFSDAAKANIKVKEQDVRLQRGKTALDVKRAYYGHLTANTSRLFLEDVLHRLDVAIALVSDWLDNGQGSVRQSDLYALQAAKAVTESYIAQAKNLENISLEGLKVLTGSGLDSELELADSGLMPLEMPSQELPVLKQSAMEQRPEMAQVEQGLVALNAMVKGQKAMSLPNFYIGIAGVISYSPGRARLDNPFIYDPFNDAGATPIVGMQWQWEQGTQSAKVNQARAELNALLEKATFAREGIPFQVAESYGKIEAGYKSVKKLEEGAKAARRWMISTYTDFDAGLEKADKIVTAFQGYVLVYTDYLRAVYDYNMEIAQMTHLTGAYQ